MTRKVEWRAWVVCLVIGVGAFALFSPALGYDYVNVDDSAYVLQNPHVNKGLLGVFGWAFTSGYQNVWQPLTWISYALECQVFGPKPGPIHAINVLLHSLNSVLVFLVLRKCTGAFWRSAAVAAFFAWHPLHVEAAAWIAERKGLLCAFFALLSLWFYAAYVEKQRATGLPALSHYVASVVLFACAVMSKPAAVTLPAALLLLDWWPLKRLSAPAKESPVSLLAEKIPFFMVSLAGTVCVILAARSNHLLDPVAAIPFSRRLISADMTCFRYLATTFWPSDLGVYYPFAFGAPTMAWLGVALLLALVSAAAIFNRKSRPFWLFGWFWFLIVLLPALDLVQAGALPMSDRYMYLPSIGLWTLICWEAWDLAAGFRHAKVIAGGLCAVLLGACGVVSSLQLRCWRNEGALLARIAEPKSNPFAHAAYAQYLLNHNQLAKAESEAEAAVAINTQKPQGWFLLAGVFLAEGKNAQAIKALKTVLHLEPASEAARLQLGRACLADKRPAEAAEVFKSAVKRQPKDFQAQSLLAQALLQQGQAADAVEEFHASLQLNPNQPDTLNDLAWLLATSPSAEIRRGAEAVQLAGRACALTKNQWPKLLGTLGAAYAENGDFDKAAATAQQARDLALSLGNKAVAQRNLELLALYKAHKPYRETP